MIPAKYVQEKIIMNALNVIMIQIYLMENVFVNNQIIIIMEMNVKLPIQQFIISYQLNEMNGLKIILLNVVLKTWNFKSVKLALHNIITIWDNVWKLAQIIQQLKEWYVMNHSIHLQHILAIY